MLRRSFSRTAMTLAEGIIVNQKEEDLTKFQRLSLVNMANLLFGIYLN